MSGNPQESTVGAFIVVQYSTAFDRMPHPFVLLNEENYLYKTRTRQFGITKKSYSGYFILGKLVLRLVME
ncbi:predicted protein [Sclerotinia sclerotiorum 1980 UF-70]|uniref:Uncharacterized protein n=1 Tax=Sclerotinia sclerotiorum (strain ATCC 18683 / 1980 / Ss-1) TaxID=665079 RepID=A7F7R5_SCLS1|nr:predicted protein [Sclerotinia sclerotiorum 1980 UF-70]EDN98786.1 predicted protein [Sclerotinia sclerotiorum 1980 UF-70]